MYASRFDRDFNIAYKVDNSIGNDPTNWLIILLLIMWYIFIICDIYILIVCWSGVTIERVVIGVTEYVEYEYINGLYDRVHCYDV